MTKIYAGGCACGAVRYETTSEPVFENHCQCLDCQKRSGTGHGLYLTFARRAEMAMTGETRSWRIVADSGKEKVHAFCPNCGTPVFVTFAAAPEAIAIHAASLDDPGQFKPQVLTYRARAHAWDRIDPDLVAFEGMPHG